MKCLYDLSNTPFGLRKGRPSLYNVYIHNTSDNTVLARDYDSGCYATIRGDGYPIPYLSIRNADTEARSVFIDVLSKGFTPKSLQDDQQYLTLLALFHRKQNLFSKGREQADAVMHQLIGKNIDAALLQEDKLRADITPYHDKLLRDTGQGHCHSGRMSLKLTSGRLSVSQRS